jgi:hypothetical protein
MTNGPYHVHKMFSMVMSANQEFICKCKDRSTANRISKALNLLEREESLRSLLKESASFRMCPICRRQLRKTVRGYEGHHCFCDLSGTGRAK